MFAQVDLGWAVFTTTSGTNVVQEQSRSEPFTFQFDEYQHGTYVMAVGQTIPIPVTALGTTIPYVVVKCIVSGDTMNVNWTDDLTGSVVSKSLETNAWVAFALPRASVGISLEDTGGAATGSTAEVLIFGA